MGSAIPRGQSLKPSRGQDAPGHRCPPMKIGQRSSEGVGTTQPPSCSPTGAAQPPRRGPHRVGHEAGWLLRQKLSTLGDRPIGPFGIARAGDAGAAWRETIGRLWAISLSLVAILPTCSSPDPEPSREL